VRTSQAVSYALAFFWLDGFAVPAPVHGLKPLGVSANKVSVMNNNKNINNLWITFLPAWIVTNGLKKFLLGGILAILVFYGFLWLSQSIIAYSEKTERDDIAIYQVAIRHLYQEIHQEHPKAVLYINRSTDDSRATDLESYYFSPLNFFHTGPPAANSVLLTQKAQQSISVSLVDLPTTIMWIDNHNDIESIVQSNNMNNGILEVVLGNIKYENGKASIYGVVSTYATVSIYDEISTWWLASRTRGYSFEKINGDWVITSTFFTDDAYY